MDMAKIFIQLHLVHSNYSSQTRKLLPWIRHLCCWSWAWALLTRVGFEMAAIMRADTWNERQNQNLSLKELWILPNVRQEASQPPCALERGQHPGDGMENILLPFLQAKSWSASPLGLELFFLLVVEWVQIQRIRRFLKQEALVMISSSSSSPSPSSPWPPRHRGHLVDAWNKRQNKNQCSSVNSWQDDGVWRDGTFTNLLASEA